MNTSNIIKTKHLTRQAIIYIRQSTLSQVIHHQESLKLQYALQQRALQLGWKEADIKIIDKDLGLSGSSTQNRKGFKEMLSKVALKEVGIILSYDVTRLSRNCSDWYPLLDICGYSDCLIADCDGIYDPSTSNGRLLLGLKGQLSELELNTISKRMTAGLLNKAKRGELKLQLPAGLVRDQQGVVHKDPNIEVRSRLEMIFDTFQRLGAATQVVRYLKEKGLDIPRLDYQKDTIWQRPKIRTIVRILKNPAYAGAFVYGRTRSVQQKLDPSRKSSKTLPMDEWKVIVKDKYPAYISWETFLNNQKKIANNYSDYKKRRTTGLPRQGSAMVAGIIYCGSCGRKISVQYSHRPRYVCSTLSTEFLDTNCQSVKLSIVDEQVVKHFLSAFAPIELDVYIHAVEQLKKTENQTMMEQQKQVQRLEYQSNLVRKQFDKVDPDNRLVAAELELRWEESLQRLKQAQLDLEHNSPKVNRFELPKDVVKKFRNIGAHIGNLWKESSLTTMTKKALIRCLIDKVVIHRTKRGCYI